MKRFLIGYCLLTTCLLFMQREAQKPLLVYHADSKYAITGKVEDKRKIGSLFTITVNGNVFVVSEERYEALLELLPQDQFSYAGTHPKWVADAVAENTLNKEDTQYDVSDLIERCETLKELKNELTEYFELEEL